MSQDFDTGSEAPTGPTIRETVGSPPVDGRVAEERARATSTDTAHTRPERWMWYAIIVLAGYAMVRSGVAAVSKPFWFDEIFTSMVAQQPTIDRMWSALRSGVDGQPPLYFLIERAASVVAPPELGLRLPSIIGFACALLCVFVFVARRSGGRYGLLAAAGLIPSLVFVTYAIEARPYSLVAAAMALALVAYQRADSIAWVIVLAVALALGEAMHHYTVFGFVAFGAAEVAYSLQRSRIRPRVWLALLVGVVPLVLAWPLLAHFKALYGQNFWARPTLGSLFAVYGNLFQVSFFWGTALAIACGVAVLGLPSWGRPRSAPWIGVGIRDSLTDERFHENVLVFFLLVAPAIVFVATRILHGGYTDRYFLYAALGIPIAMGLVLPRLGRATFVLATVVIAGAVVVQEGYFWSDEAHLRLEPPTATMEAMLRRAGHDDLPVVVADPLEYLRLSHYATGPVAPRLTYLSDTAAAMRYRRNASVELGLPILASFVPVSFSGLQTFESAHPSFLLYATPGGLGLWWPEKLLRDGYQLVALASENSRVVYLVTR